MSFTYSPKDKNKDNLENIINYNKDTIENDYLNTSIYQENELNIINQDDIRSTIEIESNDFLLSPISKAANERNIARIEQNKRIKDVNKEKLREMMEARQKRKLISHELDDEIQKKFKSKINENYLIDTSVSGLLNAPIGEFLYIDREVAKANEDLSNDFLLNENKKKKEIESSSPIARALNMMSLVTPETKKKPLTIQEFLKLDNYDNLFPSMLVNIPPAALDYKGIHVDNIYEKVIKDPLSSDDTLKETFKKKTKKSESRLANLQELKEQLIKSIETDDDDKKTFTREANFDDIESFYKNRKNKSNDNEFVVDSGNDPRRNQHELKNQHRVPIENKSFSFFKKMFSIVLVIFTALIVSSTIYGTFLLVNTNIPYCDNGKETIHDYNNSLLYFNNHKIICRACIRNGICKNGTIVKCKANYVISDNGIFCMKEMENESFLKQIKNYFMNTFYAFSNCISVYFAYGIAIFYSMIRICSSTWDRLSKVIIDKVMQYTDKNNMYFIINNVYYTFNRLYGWYSSLKSGFITFFLNAYTETRLFLLTKALPFLEGLWKN